MADHTILLVDDDAANRLLLNRIFARKRPEYEMVAVETAAGALDIAGERRIDLVLLDLTLPDMSGEQVLEKLRETHTMPVVIVSGHSDPGTSKRLLAQGAAAFVVKPYDASDLLVLVDRLLLEQGERSDE